MFADGAATGDLGSALLNGSLPAALGALLDGALPAALGAPPPPPCHPDPMMEFYKTTCTGDIWTASPLSLGEHDPMVEEALAACAAAVNRPYPSPHLGCLRRKLSAPQSTFLALPIGTSSLNSMRKLQACNTWIWQCDSLRPIRRAWWTVRWLLLASHSR